MPYSVGRDVTKRSLLQAGRTYTLIIESGNINNNENFYVCLTTKDEPMILDEIALETTSVQTDVTILEKGVYLENTGDLISSFNRNRSKSDQLLPVANAKFDPTVISEGDTIQEITHFGESVGFFGRVFTGAGNEHPFLLDTDTVYMFKFRNEDISDREYRLIFQISY